MDPVGDDAGSVRGCLCLSVLSSHSLLSIHPSDHAFSFYKDVIERIKARVEEEFGARVFFTSPTFITRIVGNPDWQPRSMHDEYW